MMRPAPYGMPFLTATGEVLRLSVLFLATGMTLSGVIPPQAMAQSFPTELPSVTAPAASNPQPVDAVTTEVETKSVETIPAGNIISFALGTLVVGDEEKEKLRQHGAYLKDNPKKTVTLVGSAESFGSRAYALADAEARLAAVSKWLRVYGASLRQIRRNLVDSVKRSTTCRSSDCRPPPRRVELEYAP